MNTPIVLLCVTTLFGFHATLSGAEELKGFLGFTWGATVDFVKKETPRRTHGLLKTFQSNSTHLTFAGGKVAGLRFTTLDFSFDPGLHGVTVEFEDAKPGHKSEYLTLKELLTAKYGPPIDEHDECIWEIPNHEPLPDFIHLAINTTRRGTSLEYEIHHKVPWQLNPATEQTVPRQPSSDPKDDL